jgi:sRNA-binding protein
VSQTDKRAVNTIHAILRDRFPRAFPRDYDAIRPLKTGILADVIARMPGFDPGVLRRALANHTSRDGYLLALIHGRGDRRYDLDGQPVGTVTPEERAEAQKRLDASTQRGQAKAVRVREHQEREEKRRHQREIERKNREAKAARKAEHARIQQEIAARKAALLAQGITPESRSERKRRLAREAAERAARRSQAPRPTPDRPPKRAGPAPAPRPERLPERAGPAPAPRPEPRPVRPEPTPDEPATRPPYRVEPEPAKPLPPVAFRKKRRFVPPDGNESG